jgi:hypothetical protein
MALKLDDFDDIVPQFVDKFEVECVSSNKTVDLDEFLPAFTNFCGLHLANCPKQ